ncbi:MAG: hypothetical protein U9R44_03550 [Candidatus Omnitrophota bacterium]|nr:hypothetical protein [Candidatus Omnitrophota bacterium]
MAEWLFNRKGNPCLFLYEDRFISREGKNLGWLVNNNVYSLGGKHIGWFENDVLYDEYNRTFAFQKEAIACLPSVPWTEGNPEIPAIEDAPERPDMSSEPGRPGYSLGWAEENVEELFLIDKKVEA